MLAHGIYHVKNIYATYLSILSGFSAGTIPVTAKSIIGSLTRYLLGKLTRKRKHPFRAKWVLHSRPISDILQAVVRPWRATLF